MLHDVIIIGGGAAGFFSAIHIAENVPNASIAIFERGKNVLSKVKVSGGGRCNVTHAEFNPKKLVKNYPRGEKELLGPFHHYAPGDVFTFFEKRGVHLKVEEDGRVFPKTDSSQTIIDCFLNETNRLGIHVLRNSGIKEFTFLEEEKCWRVTTQNKHYFAQKVLLATGNNTKIWDQLQEFGHNIITPIPSLFTFNIDDDRLRGNQGISAMAQITLRPKRKFDRDLKAFLRENPFDVNMAAEGPVLITHWGLSGPAVLKLSAWGAPLLHAYDYKFKIRVNWVPEYSLESLLSYFIDMKDREPRKTIFRTKVLQLPNRLWQTMVKSARIPLGLTWADCTKSELQELAQQLTGGIYAVTGKSTFKEEFVTAGGVDLKEIDCKTFKSKKLPHLYFAGEITNVDAITGGFNFQNAWTGAYLAAQAISRELVQGQEQ